MKEKVYIIAGGNSVSDVNLQKLQDGDVIAVNKSILDYPNAKYFITMDHSFLKKLDLKKRVLSGSPATKFFIANLVPEYMEEKNGGFNDSRWNLQYNLRLFDVIIKSRAYEGFGRDWNDFRSGMNSGYCAIQLGIILGYKEIYLIGYDLMAHQQTHYHGGYGESLEAFNKKLEIYFASLKKAILDWKAQDTDTKLYNCSAMSRLDDLLQYREI